LLLSFLRISSVGSTAAFVLLLVWQFSSRLHASMAQMQNANQALQDALMEVQRHVDTQARLLEENEQQRATIADLSVPVLPISQTTLLLPLIGRLDAARLQVVQEQVLTVVYHAHAQRLLVDITGLTQLDTTLAQGMLGLSRGARLLGVEVAFVGIRAGLAQTLVASGVELQGVRVYRNLETALSDALSLRKVA
jgi:rsbT co-antagonist protein RsbR